MQKVKQVSVAPVAVIEEDAEVLGAGAAAAEDATEARRLEGRTNRAFVWLLQLAGLTALPGWIGLLWTAALYSLQSMMTYYFVYDHLKTFTQMRDAGTPFFAALSQSRYVALPNLVQWFAFTACFFWGQRHYTALLSETSRVLADIKMLPGAKGSHRAGKYMMTLTGLSVVLLVTAACFHVLPVCREGPTSLCAYHLGRILSYDYIYLANQLIGMKFVFVGLMLNSGFADINRALELVVATGGDETQLRSIGQLQKRLCKISSRLSYCMTPELISVITYGILLEIVLLLMITNGSSAQTPLIQMLLYLSAAIVSMFGPCETGQLLLTRLGQCRDLLLELEWQQPRLAELAEMLQRSVSRDLDTLGDLGFFCLRRSTLLAISSTIVTYIIVIAQNYITCGTGFVQLQEECACPQLRTT